MKIYSSNLLNHFRSQSIKTKRILNEFRKPIHENIYFRNYPYLARKSNLVPFDEDKWKRRPSLFCSDYYDDPYLYPVILLLNNIGSIYDFIPEKLIKNMILAPEKNVIFEILSLPNM